MNFAIEKANYEFIQITTPSPIVYYLREVILITPAGSMVCARA